MHTDSSLLATRLSAATADQFVARLTAELDALLRLLQEQCDRLAEKKRIDPAGGEAHAVAVLRFARYAPAAGLFVQLIDVRQTDFPTVSDEWQAHYRFFPFAVAAAAVGNPAVPALIATVADADVGSTRFALACLVLKEIFGEEFALQLVATAAGADVGRREEAAKVVRTPADRWEATSCTDYAIR